jgi:phage tail sheath protein FI
MSYKHGIYTDRVANAGGLTARAQGTIPVYIGTAPIHKATDYVSGGGDKVNTPILINSYREAERLIGYSDAWDKFTLCEAVYAHFMNTIRPIAPIVVIVMNDGAAGEDFEISSMTATNFKNALAALNNVEQICGVIPNIICAPEFADTNITDLVTYCTNGIANKWGTVAYTDIPTASVSTVAAAITRQTAEGTKIVSKVIRPHFPKTAYNGKVYHLSVLDCVATQWADSETEGVACRSSSNTAIDCDAPCLNDTTKLYFSEEEANSLNAVGITTVNYIGGEYRIWGGHMANYRYDGAATTDPQDRSDATIRADIFLHNWLKHEFLDNIDFPVSRRDIDGIVANVNIGLNSFVKNGYLLKGECYFTASNNTTAELAEGDITLDVQYTSVPNGKSITFAVQYTTEGLNNIIEEEQGA